MMEPDFLISPSRARLLLGVFLVLLGLGLGVAILRGDKGTHTRTEVAIATVLKAAPVQFGVGPVAYRAYNLRYSFDVQGRTITTEQLVDVAPSGREVHVDYDPRNPDNCSLLVETSQNNVPAFLMVGFAGAGAWLIWREFPRRKRA